MKKGLKALALLLVIVLLAGCAGGANATKDPSDQLSGEEENSAGVPDSAAGKFSVGYARGNITPEESVPLSGYGRSETRMSNGFLDYEYTTCVAFTDEAGETVLLFTTDIVVSSGELLDPVRQKISKETGIPENQILMAATHTHSMIATGCTGIESVNRWIGTYTEILPKVALEALADRKPATMKWTTADLTGYNYVRHYITDLGESVGDNHGDLHVGTLIAHQSEANSVMSLLSIEREGGKPILMANWRVHPTVTGGAAKKDISADIVGSIRTYIEKRTDYLFAYFQGDAGNMNPRTRLSSDVEFNPPKDFKEYGEQAGEIILTALKDNDLKTVTTGKIETTGEIFTGNVNHTMDQYAAIGLELRTKWDEDGDSNYVYVTGAQYGINSPYHAGAIADRASMANTRDIKVYAGRIGAFAFTMVPLECFDQNGNFVRQNSPSEFTFFIGYSNTHAGYLPSQEGYQYECYESDIGTFEPGTGELLASKLVNMLKGLFK